MSRPLAFMAGQTKISQFRGTSSAMVLFHTNLEILLWEFDAFGQW